MTEEGQARQLSVPISLPGVQTAALAAFFYPATAPRLGILQVVVHGNSYDHRYWNAPDINGQSYSYVRYMTRRGFDVLAIDLPGVGASTKPLGFTVTAAAAGEALSALITSLRHQHSILHAEFDLIASVGHSMGSTLGVYAEANWPAADCLVVTATGFYPHRSASAWPAGLREKLLETDYALVPPDIRRTFYHEPSADPDVIDYDNTVLRTPAPSGLWGDCIALRDSPHHGAAQVACPVYIQLGEFDPVMPGRFRDEERRCYAASPAIVVDSLPDIGHSFNLHLNAHLSWDGISDYLRQTRPRSGNNSDYIG